MENTGQNEEQIAWKDEYSVGVKKIDDQHKKLFDIINQLINMIKSAPKEQEVASIIGKIAEYKNSHFATEETYFHQFDFEGTEEHEEAHRKFNVKLADLQNVFQADALGFAFALTDFLENWLIEHLMNMDQKYKACFQKHGLN